jgi:DNA-binding Lrp family transcriptional regulator
MQNFYKMDKKNKNNSEIIMKLLQENSRYTIKEISNKTQIKPSTVYQTINKLNENGTIERFTVKLSDSKLNRNFTVFMLITTSRDIDPSFFKNEFIEDAYGVTGEYDILVKMKFKDVAEFNEFLINFRKNKAIIKTLTMVGTTKIKDS